VLSALFVAFAIGFVAGHGPAPLRASAPEQYVMLIPGAQQAVLGQGANVVALANLPVLATLIVTVNGVDQSVGTDYTIAGTVITFVALDPLDTPNVDIHYWTVP
jgi:hypothetical protein